MTNKLKMPSEIIAFQGAKYGSGITGSWLARGQTHHVGYRERACYIREDLLTAEQNEILEMRKRIQELEMELLVYRGRG